MRFWNYAMLAFGMALLFEMAGIPIATGSLEWVGLSANGLTIYDASLWKLLFGTTGILLLVTASAGLVIGFFTKSPPENYIVLGLYIEISAIILGIFIGIVSYAHAHFPGWIELITLFIMGMMSIGFILCLPDAFRGIH